MGNVQQAPWHDLPAGISAHERQTLLQGHAPAFPQISQAVMSAGRLGHWAFFSLDADPSPVVHQEFFVFFVVLTVPTLSWIKGATPREELSRALSSHDTGGLLAL